MTYEFSIWLNVNKNKWKDEVITVHWGKCLERMGREGEGWEHSMTWSPPSSHRSHHHMSTKNHSNANVRSQPQLNTMAWFSLISSCRRRRLLDAPRILWDLVDRVLLPIPNWGSKGMDCWDPTRLKADDVPDDLASGLANSGRCITGAGADTTDKPGGPLLDVTRGRSKITKLVLW